MSPSRYLGLVRGALLLAGGVAVCLSVAFGATLHEPPPGGDGVPTGFAVFFVLLAQSAGTLTAQIGFALPAGTGRFRFGPLAGRSGALRAATATGAFAATALLLTIIGWVLPETLPRVVSNTYAFSWLGAAVGTTTGVSLTAILTVATALVRLVRGDPVLGTG